MNIKNVSLILITVVSVFLYAPSLISAAQTDGINYSVSAIIPDNQIDKQNSYFDLKMSSHQSEQISVRVYNSGNDSIRVKSEIHDALTSTSGTMNYLSSDNNTDSSLRYSLKNITSLENSNTIDVPAHSSKTINATIKMPDLNNFNGIILGGWYFEKDNTDKKINSSFGINNKYSYVVGIKYTVGDSLPNPNIKLNSVKPSLSNGHTAVLLNIQNTTPVIISGLTYDTKIYKSGSNKIVKSNTIKNGSMAPNSNFDMSVLYGSTPLTAGDYVAKVSVKNKDHNWQFEKKFTVTAKDAQTINSKTLDKMPINPIWYAILGSLITIILIVIFFIARKVINTRKKE